MGVTSTGEVWTALEEVTSTGEAWTASVEATLMEEVSYLELYVEEPWMVLAAGT